jgi:hypothetical protein
LTRKRTAQRQRDKNQPHRRDAFDDPTERIRRCSGREKLDAHRDGFDERERRRGGDREQQTKRNWSEVG